MKTRTVLFFIALTLLGAGVVNAQTETEINAQVNVTPLEPAKLKDGYAMHQGNMVQIKNGEMTPLTKDVTLANGTKVMRDGTVVFPRNRRGKIKEGYVLNAENKIVLLEYDMLQYHVIQDHAQKTVGNTQTELIVTDTGIPLLANSPEAQMANRKVAIINERNALVKQKADLLNKAKNVKEQQNSPAIKKVDEQLQQLEDELKQIETNLQKQ